jgi:hypothetical protein
VTFVKGRRRTPEQIVRKLREADRVLGGGAGQSRTCSAVSGFPSGGLAADQPASRVEPLRALDLAREYFPGVRAELVADAVSRAALWLGLGVVFVQGVGEFAEVGAEGGEVGGGDVVGVDDELGDVTDAALQPVGSTTTSSTSGSAAVSQREPTPISTP